MPFDEGDMQPTLAPEKQTVPWYVWCSVAAVTFAMVGVHWDISWHRSIGRDTFWTPAHIAIHLCGVLAGISCGYLVLNTTFSPRSLLRDCSVWIWGFRGPLGAFIAAWGGIAMITSAPFDNWWHDAYGLDVKIISPPHMVLAMGVLAVHLGGLILILGQMNRATGALQKQLRAMFIYVGGMTMVCLTVLQMEITTRIAMHTAHFYYLVSLVVPLVLAGVGRASNYRWGATAVAGVYSVFVFLMGRILPLFPAEPKLGPVYHQVTQFTPPEFPLLIIIPAVLLDLIWQRTEGWSTPLRALVSGPVFVGAFALVQWPWADFLASPAARNWFFGSKYFGYYVGPNSIFKRFGFVPTEQGSELWTQVAAAVFTAMITCTLGLAWGNWMRRIRR
jgi:hypothetical protein